MRVLVIGSGGREHALAWKIAQSPLCEALFAAPGNGGTYEIAQNVSIQPTDLKGLLAFAVRERIDLTVVGPEGPLAMGIVDLFREHGRRVFGPTQEAARIESSKVDAKKLMHRGGVLTAQSRSFTSAPEAIRHVRENPRKFAVKADGLAGGKGVVLCQTVKEAERAIHDLMVKRVYKEAGERIVIEELLEGPEISLHALCGRTDYHLFPPAQDHKRAFDGDLGPNTGGMGTIAPVPWITQTHLEYIEYYTLSPALKQLYREGHPFTGCLFPGVMLTPDGPRVLEFNARWGDPETQVYMGLLENDLLPLLYASADGDIEGTKQYWAKDRFAACIVLTSGGYPETSSRDAEITIAEEALSVPNVQIFHAGTKREDGRLLTNGGRVLNVTATGPTLQEALDTAYRVVPLIHFEGMRYRTDIGADALRRSTPP